MSKNEKEKQPKKCDMCFGTGVDEAPDDPCIYCKGSGKYKDKFVEGEKELAEAEAKKSKAKKSEPTMKELLAEAKELGLKNYSKLNKTDLEEVISEAKADKKESEEKAEGKASKKK